MGHSHPNIVKAVQDQAAKHAYFSLWRTNSKQPTAYAKALTDHLPSNLNTVYYVSSGTEATEGAAKTCQTLREEQKSYPSKFLPRLNGRSAFCYGR